MSAHLRSENLGQDRSEYGSRQILFVASSPCQGLRFPFGFSLDFSLAARRSKNGNLTKRTPVCMGPLVWQQRRKPLGVATTKETPWCGRNGHGDGNRRVSHIGFLENPPPFDLHANSTHIPSCLAILLGKHFIFLLVVEWLRDPNPLNVKCLINLCSPSSSKI